jgi:hypothetical protein
MPQAAREMRKLVWQKTNEKSKARKNKLIVANQLLLKDNYVSNSNKTKGIYTNFGW